MKILITPRGFANYGQPELKKLQNVGFEVDYNDTGQAYAPEVFLAKAQNAAAIIVGVDLIDRTVIDACPDLQVICKFGVGTDNIDVEYCREKGILVERTLGTNTAAVAEHVMALMFAAAKNIVSTANEVKGGGWQKPTGQELACKTLGIIGFGAIGKQLADLAHGMKMTVLVNDMLPLHKELLNAHHCHQASFEQVLQQADYLSLHLPLTTSTQHLIGATELKQMKKTACLINTARGGIVDEAALYQALTNQEIRAACFDVFSSEPPQKNEPLLKLNNFLLTPHTAARTAESEKRTCTKATEIIIKQLERNLK
ncbi:phosphoglycerate dehydrogenase [Enterococcus sp. UD-01]|jgi:phosphoglycerate dehydrogenase-like enzyme|uniref:phosphoglycerate dehydrogenase n=1 Tax=Enterococcus sp. UD-01 TaxID=3373911 RepID=UPI003833E0A7